MGAVEVVPYDPEWPRVFERLHGELAPALAGVRASIDHVGSTAVPGLDAKPVIDVSVGVAEAGDVPRAIEALSTLGYEHRGDLGIRGREAFIAPAGSVRHNLYVCVAGNTAHTNHLHVRDALRGSASLRRRYGALKRALAAAHAGDIDAYTRAKTDLLMEILACGPLTGDQLAEIRAQNA